MGVESEVEAMDNVQERLRLVACIMQHYYL
jgi:hypothetical protein